MEIQLSSKYRLESDPQGGYNLFEKHTHNVTKVVGGKKVQTGEVKDVETVVGYNMSVERAVSKAIELNLHTKQVKVNLKEFLESYKKEKANLTQLLTV